MYILMQRNEIDITIHIYHRCDLWFHTMLLLWNNNFYLWLTSSSSSHHFLNAGVETGIDIPLLPRFIIATSAPKGSVSKQQVEQGIFVRNTSVFERKKVVSVFQDLFRLQNSGKRINLVFIVLCHFCGEVLRGGIAKFLQKST